MNWENIKQSLNNITQDTPDIYYGLDIQERLQREIDYIQKHNMEPMFDEVSCGENIKGNPSNSLVLWVLGITDEFPIGEFAPVTDIVTDRMIPIDIDIDVSADKRQEIIGFIQQKMQAYPIVAFNTLNTKSAIKELGKALGFPYSMMNSITQSIEDGNETKLTEAVKYKYPNFFNEVKGLEGAINHLSVHASGIAVFSGNPEDHLISLRKAPRESTPIVDMDGDSLGTLGVMKVDLLGSATTDVIAEVEKLSGCPLPPDDIITNDRDTIAGFTNNYVAGIFQAGGDANRAVFSTVKPQTFQEVADCISLARPGAKEQIPAYCKYQPDITNELVLDILKDTRGILLYQEQVLELVKTLGNLNSTEAEQLRSAIAKKKNLDVVKPLQEKFIENAREKIGHDADHLWEVIEKHVLYSFNKSHAVAYSLQAFRQMWQKNNFPTEFWCAMLNHCNQTELYEYRYECARLGIQLLMPNCMNYCTKATVPKKGYIQLPVTMIKGVGDSLAMESCIVDCHNIHAAIKCFPNANKKSLSILATIGFFDPIEPDRDKVLQSIEQKGQMALFEDITPSHHKPNLFDLEREYLGTWITTHPMQKVETNMSISDVLFMGGKELWGRVDSYVIKKDRKGEDMAFMVVGDDVYFAKCLIFSKTLGKLTDIPIEGGIVRVKGFVSNDIFIVQDVERI